MSDCLIRIEEVMVRTGMGRWTVYDAIADGRFPRQYRISHKQARWSREEIDQWIEEQKEARG